MASLLTSIDQDKGRIAWIHTKYFLRNHDPNKCILTLEDLILDYFANTEDDAALRDEVRNMYTSIKELLSVFSVLSSSSDLTNVRKMADAMNDYLL